MEKDVFKGLAHVAVFTDKYEESIKFYIDVLPMRLVKELCECKPEDSSGFFPMRYAMVKLNDLYIEIMEAGDKRIFTGPGEFHHIGICVSDLDQAIQFLVKRGFPQSSIPTPSLNSTLYPGKTFRATQFKGPNNEIIGLYEQNNREFFDE